MKIVGYLLLVTLIISMWILPSVTPIFGITFFLFSLGITIYNIFEKYKETENSRIKIAKEVLVFIATFLLISFLGGIAGLLTNFYVSNTFGTMIGFACAMLSGMIVGFLVRKVLQN